MPFTRSVRYSTVFGSAIPAFLVIAIIFSLVINLILAALRHTSACCEDEPHLTKETIKGMALHNEVLQLNLNRCRASKRQTELVETRPYQGQGNMNSIRKTNGLRKSRHAASVRHHQVVQLADGGGSKDEARMTINRKLFNYMANSLRDTRYPGVENYTRYAVARLGLLPLTHVDALVPAFGPVINDVLAFRYPLAIAPCSNGNSDRSASSSVFIAVVSACGNFDKRNTIRQTWKQHLKTVQDEGLLAIAGFAFILGLPANDGDATIQRRIEAESRTHADIIQIGTADSYDNLSLKGAALLNWLHKNCAASANAATAMDFLAKVDDDVYVNVRNLAYFVQSRRNQSRKSIYGVGKARSGWPDRDGKWAMTYEEWPWNEYPPYMLGAIALMSADVILPLLGACQTTPMIPLEDVYLYGMCAEKAGIQIHYSANPNRALVGSIIRAPTTCELRTLIAWRPDHLDATKVREIMHLSQRMTESFYQNTSQCIVESVTAIHGVDIATVVAIDRIQAVHFTFS